MYTIQNMKKEDLYQVNLIISRAFTQARVEDGYSYTDVPLCQKEFIEMYYFHCPEGCFIIEEMGQIKGASFCHLWGKTGWIGPLAISPEKQHLGMGKQIAQHSVNFLIKKDCSTIGLETNPRSNKNLGFYGKLGFTPSFLTLDLIKPVSPLLSYQDLNVPHKTIHYSYLNNKDKNEFLNRINELTASVLDTIDYRKVIVDFDNYNLGDTLLYLEQGNTIGFSIVQTQPSLVEEQNAFLRIIVFLVHPRSPENHLKYFLYEFLKYAKSKALNRILIRIPIYSTKIFNELLNYGYRVVNSDLRMVLSGYPEKQHCAILHTNRWL